MILLLFPDKWIRDGRDTAGKLVAGKSREARAAVPLSPAELEGPIILFGVMSAVAILAGAAEALIFRNMAREL